jgi:hypothetical protein
MFESLLFIAVLVIGVALFTYYYNSRPLKPLPSIKPRFEFFPKYIASYQRDDAEVELSIGQMGFRATGAKGVYTRGTVRDGLKTKSIKLTVAIDREQKTISIYSTYFGILFDNGDIWQLTHDIVNGAETALELQKNRTQELVDLFDKKN